jgi:hypothetical protein
MERKKENTVWTEVFLKGVRVPNSMKKDAAIRNMCNKNDGPRNRSDSHTKTTMQKQEWSQIKRQKEVHAEISQ